MVSHHMILFECSSVISLIVLNCSFTLFPDNSELMAAFSCHNK